MLLAGSQFVSAKQLYEIGPWSCVVLNFVYYFIYIEPRPLILFWCISPVQPWMSIHKYPRQFSQSHWTKRNHMRVYDMVKDMAYKNQSSMYVFICSPSVLCDADLNQAEWQRLFHIMRLTHVHVHVLWKCFVHSPKHEFAPLYLALFNNKNVVNFETNLTRPPKTSH